MPYRKSDYYTIYLYRAPDGRVYIGKTSLPRGYRAGAGGIGYRHCSRFWKAIEQYGWEAFEYEVLATVRKSEVNAEKRACELETAFIQKYQSHNAEYGFNRQLTDKPRSYEAVARLHQGRRIVNKDGIVRQVLREEFDSYIQQGWSPGYKKAS